MCWCCGWELGVRRVSLRHLVNKEHGRHQHQGNLQVVAVSFFTSVVGISGLVTFLASTLPILSRRALGVAVTLLILAASPTCLFEAFVVAFTASLIKEPIYIQGGATALLILTHWLVAEGSHSIGDFAHFSSLAFYWEWIPKLTAHVVGPAGSAGFALTGHLTAHAFALIIITYRIAVVANFNSSWIAACTSFSKTIVLLFFFIKIPAVVIHAVANTVPRLDRLGVISGVTLAGDKSGICRAGIQ